MAVAAAAGGSVGDPVPHTRPAPRDGRAGFVDRIVAEHPDAADEPEAYCLRVAYAIRHELGELSVMEPHARLAARHARWRAL